MLQAIALFFALFITLALGTWARVGIDTEKEKGTVLILMALTSLAWSCFYYLSTIVPP